MKKLSKFIWLLPAIVAMIGLAACGKSIVMDKGALGKVKTVAVIGYTTPKTIKFRDNPRENKEPFLAMAINAAMGPNGAKAATLAHETFVKELNNQGLSFRFLTRSELMANTEYRNLAKKMRDLSLAEQAKKASSGGTMGKALSMLGGGGGATGPRPGASPDGMPQFGLLGGYKLYGTVKRTTDELDYMDRAAKALNVDAVMLVDDSGYSFSCDACLGGTGSASTGSAFLSTMIDRNGKTILELRQWFATSKGSAVVAAYVVNPLQWDKLFRAHGQKMAVEWAEQYKEDWAAKK